MSWMLLLLPPPLPLRPCPKPNGLSWAVGLSGIFLPSTRTQHKNKINKR